MPHGGRAPHGQLLGVTCGSDDDGSSQPKRAADPVVRGREAALPVTVETAQGEVTIDAEPTRIVSLSPSLTEMLFAIDAGDQVVAVDSNSTSRPARRSPTSAASVPTSRPSPATSPISSCWPATATASSTRSARSGSPCCCWERRRPPRRLPRDRSPRCRHRPPGRGGEVVGAACTRRSRPRSPNRVPDASEPLRYFYELSDASTRSTSETFIGDLLGLVGLESIADAADAAAGGSRSSRPSTSSTPTPT